MDAQQARQQTKDAIDAQVRDLEAMVMEKISDAIKRGEYSVMVSIGGKGANAQSALRTYLTDSGYTLKESSGRDQRDYGYVTISWSA